MSDSKTNVTVTTGRRKTASARVRLFREGRGKITINDRDLEGYCYEDTIVRTVRAPLVTVDAEEQFDLEVKVSGGGPHGQATAIAHGIARALEKHNPEFRLPLKRAGHLKRDPRKRERKKSGQPGARKRFQFSKR
jgi:small subunit ribosomal protein S9